MQNWVNVYCDESAHLEHDNLAVMVLGAIHLPAEKVYEVETRIKEIKGKHRIPSQQEMKWQKVSQARLGCYMELVDYFFDNPCIQFRGLIAPKDSLQHARHSQTHDTWYFKMYFNLLKIILNPAMTYAIYLDIKDTRSQRKIEKLRDILETEKATLDFRPERLIARIQPIRSHEIQLMQLVDILIGAIGYANRGSSGSTTKLALVKRIQERSQLSLTRNTLYQAQKVNLLRWRPSVA